jgi:hypothetical protein
MFQGKEQINQRLMRCVQCSDDLSGHILQKKLKLLVATVLNPASENMHFLSLYFASIFTLLNFKNMDGLTTPCFNIISPLICCSPLCQANPCTILASRTFHAMLVKKLQTRTRGRYALFYSCLCTMWNATDRCLG